MASYARPAVLAVLLALAVQSASAQGLWDSLFGPEEVLPSRPASGYVRTKPAAPLFDELFGPGEFDTPQPNTRAATYRTFCVRMCDGFYFPISYATSDANFTQDAEKCAASCGGARLFYAPNAGGDIGSMLDLSGRAYASYPVAFRYRKALVQGCQCRPQPWTESERARHRAYAASHPSGALSSTPVAEADTRTVGPPFAVQSNFADAELFAPEPSPHPRLTPRFAAQEDLRAIHRPAPFNRQWTTGQWDWSLEPGRSIRARSPYDAPGTP